MLHASIEQGETDSAEHLPPAPAVGRHAIISLGTSLALQAISLVTGVLTARFLGPVGKGEWSAILLWTGLLIVVGYLGISEAMTYFTARQAGREKVVFGTGLAAAGVQAVVLAAAGWLIIPIALQGYAESVTETGHLFLWWIPLNLLAIYGACMLAGGLQFTAYNAVRLSVGLATVAGLVGLALADAISVRHVALVYLGANLITAAVAIEACRRCGWFGVNASGRLLKDMLRYGLKTHTASVSSMINQRADQMVVSLFLGPAQLGLYVTALTFTMAVTVIGSSVGMVGMPVVARMQDRSTRVWVLGRLVRGTLAASLVVAAALFVLVPALVELFFGQAFASAAGPARLLLLGGVVLSTNHVVSSGLRGLGQPLASGMAELTSLVVTVLALAIFLPLLGLLGAGLALLLGSLSGLTFTLALLSRRLAIPLSQLLIPRWDDLRWTARIASARLWGRPQVRRE